MLIFCVGCGQTDARLNAVGADRGKRAAERMLPELPTDCRALSRAGVRVGDRLDVALLKADRALLRQNDRTLRCAEWHDQLRVGLASISPQVPQ